MSVTFTGMDDVAKALEKLPKQLQRRAEYAALGGAGKAVADVMQGKVTAIDTGALRNSIGFNVRYNKRAKGLTVRIGPKSGYVSSKSKNGKLVRVRPQNYSHLIEFGTVKQSAKPFIEPALQSSKGQALQAMSKSYEAHLQKTIRQVRKKGLPKKRASR